MWVGHFWRPLQGALSQFIDIQGFDPLTTGMSLRLRQPCLSVLCRAEKPGGPPSPPASLCAVVMVSKSVRLHYVTLMWAHSLFLPLFLFFLWLSIVLFHRGGCQRELSVRWQCLVCHGHPYTYTVQRRAASKKKKKKIQKASLPQKRMATDIFPLCCAIWAGVLYPRTCRVRWWIHTAGHQVQITANHIPSRSLSGGLFRLMPSEPVSCALLLWATIITSLRYAV